MQVNESVRSEIVEQVDGLIGEYLNDIDKAYLKAEKALTVSLSVNMKPTKNEDGIDIETTMSFVAEKITDKKHGSCSRQMKIEEAAHKDMGNRMKPHLHRLHPRHLIDIRQMRCLKGYGPHCTLRYPCYLCGPDQ